MWKWKCISCELSICSLHCICSSARHIFIAFFGYLKGTPSEEASWVLLMGMKWKKNILAAVFLLISLLKINVWKLWKHGHEQYHFVSCGPVSAMFWTRPACVAQVWIVAFWASLFPLFGGKEWTNMVTPWRPQFGSKQYLCCINIDATTKQSPQKKIFAHFLCYQANLCLAWGLL